LGIATLLIIAFLIAVAIHDRMERQLEASQQRVEFFGESIARCRRDWKRLPVPAIDRLRPTCFAGFMVAELRWRSFLARCALQWVCPCSPNGWSRRRTQSKFGPDNTRSRTWRKTVFGASSFN
jgi:hypothetical protein